MRPGVRPGSRIVPAPWALRASFLSYAHAVGITARGGPILFHMVVGVSAIACASARATDNAHRVGV
jgi:hypothetical protein